MNDLISRKEAIDEIRFYIKEPNIFDDEIKIKGYNDGLEMAISIISMLSSAEPERKYGEWLPHPHEREWDVCSVCGIGCKRREFEMWFGQERFTEYSYQYCPHCGAEMTRGE